MKNFGGYFDPQKKFDRIKDLEEVMNNPNFWNDKRESEKVISELNELKRVINKTEILKDKISSNYSMVESLKNELDLEIKELLELEISDIKDNLDSLEIELLLDGPYDSGNAIVEIHSGAGGTEACDWANMLFRMYNRWCEKKNYKVEIIDSQEGEEVGIKSLTMFVKGINAYGYLKCEKGVHRLIRISPFDSNSRRHTSFASVEVTPLIESGSIEIEINPNDIRVDVYRSSGCGGQGVNTTDSAVRITHIPTKIVVTCQNERSQIQNKEKAMEVLKSKLYQLELDKRNNEIQELKGNQVDINFGSQIRSYIMCPYSLVKDHRTNCETSNVDKVLDGDIDLFINSNLKEVK